jgi:hypothetical protein
MANHTRLYGLIHKPTHLQAAAKIDRLEAQLARTTTELREATTRAELAERSAQEAWRFAKQMFGAGART